MDFPGKGNWRGLWLPWVTHLGGVAARLMELEAISKRNGWAGGRDREPFYSLCSATNDLTRDGLLQGPRGPAHSSH